MALSFQKYAQHGQEIIDDLANYLGYPEDKARAGRVLNTTLHVLRDLLTTEESLQLLAQLPMAIKSVYVAGWSLKQKRDKIRTLDDFVDRIKTLDRSAFTHDFENSEKAIKAVAMVFNVLTEHTSKGEIDDVKAQLPKALKDLARSHVFIEELNKATMI